jgi:hypothetical protein
VLLSASLAERARPTRLTAFGGREATIERSRSKSQDGVDTGRGRRTAVGAESRVDVPEIPDRIVLRRHRDLEGRRNEVWVRRGLLALAGVIPLLALFNLFGQRPETSRAASSAATLKVYAPSRLRGGLLYEARFTITAQQDLKEATLVLDPGWAESITINTIEPSPVGEASRNGKLAFELGHIAAGDRHILFIEFQVNPTNVGHRSQDVELTDGETHLLTIHRDVTIFP